jgi:hypothetical protein
MEAAGYVQCTPRRPDPAMATRPVIDFTSGYVQRALEMLPRQGDRTPWRLHQSYFRDLALIRWGRVAEAMEFKPAARPARVLRVMPR